MGELKSALGHLVISWIRAIAADGDGPPNWFWPSIQTAAMVAIVATGFWYATDRVEFAKFIVVPFATYCGTTFALWLGFRGWKYFRQQEPPK